MPAVERSIEIKASPDVVWRWLASQDALRRWVHPGIEIDLQVGGAYRMQEADADTWISGYVLELLPAERLVLSWLEEGGDWVHPARLVIALTETATGTCVTLCHDGFAGIGKPEWRKTVEAYNVGIDRHQLLQRLASLVDAEQASHAA